MDGLVAGQNHRNTQHNSLVGLIGAHHRANGGSGTGAPSSGISRTSDMLSSIRRPLYIKEELSADMNFQNPQDSYDNSGFSNIQQPSAQELERMANAETPPALSNVELTNSILASLTREVFF